VTATTVEQPAPEAVAAAESTTFMVVLSVAVLSFALGQTALFPSLPAIAQELGTTTHDASWAITAFLLSAAICTPVIGRLGDVYGARRMLHVVLGLLIFGALIAAATGTLWGIVCGRIVQGSAGGLMPLCVAIIRRSSRPGQAAPRIGLLSAFLGAGAGLGLVIGGLLTDHVGYQGIFWLVAVMAAGSSLAAARFVPSLPGDGGRVDLRTAPLLGVGLALPLIAISEGNHWGWAAPQTLGLVASGLAALTVWTQLERRSRAPIANIEMLARPKVLLTNATTFLVGWGMLGAFILTPQLLEAPSSTSYGFGLDATQAGLLMLPASLGLLFLGPASARLGARVGHKVPLALGAGISFAGLVLTAWDHSSAAAIIGFGIVAAAGNSLAFAAMPNLIVESVEPHETGQATGQNAVLRMIGSSVGTAVAGGVLAANLAPSGLATDAAYSAAYAVAAAVTLGAGLLALTIPRRAALRT
jgi:MFS family permease